MSVLDRPVEVRGPKRDNGRHRLIAIAVLIAMVLAGLGVWAMSDGSTSPPEEEIQALLDDYLEAWVTKDEAVVRSTVIEDFVLNEYVYGDGELGVYLYYDVNDDVNGVLRQGFSANWTNEQVGDLLVTGDGPWFVSVEENWTDSPSEPEGQANYGPTQLEGQANYTIVEVDGELRIANHYWAGLNLAAN